MRYWFDTEFLEDGTTIKLISIGIVSEDGREFYAESDHAHMLADTTDWLRQNVKPHLSVRGSAGMPRDVLAQKVLAFVGQDKPELWAYYADYDWVALCQLFGTMMDLPKGWPRYCRDVKQLCDDLGNPKMPKQDATEHHALADAKWTRDAWKYLTEVYAPMMARVANRR